MLVFEPVPHFRAFLEYNVYLNGIEHLVEFHTSVVSHVHNQPMTMMVPSNGIWGTAGIDGLNIDAAIISEEGIYYWYLPPYLLNPSTPLMNSDLAHAHCQRPLLAMMKRPLAALMKRPLMATMTFP